MILCLQMDTIRNIYYKKMISSLPDLEILWEKHFYIKINTAKQYTQAI